MSGKECCSDGIPLKAVGEGEGKLKGVGRREVVRGGRMRNTNLVKISFCVCAGVILLILLVTTTLGLLYRYEVADQSCKGLGGVDGTCTLLTKCNYTGDFEKDQPPICSSQGKEPIVCCPNDPVSRTRRPGSLLRQYCTDMEQNCTKTRKMYYESLKNQITRQVLGGTEPLPLSHKHMVVVGYGPLILQQWGCGGSLITSKYVLTAGHCISSPTHGDAKWVILGDMDLVSEYDDVFIQPREIVKTIPHPLYKRGVLYHDIGLLELDREVQFTAGVAPACLYTEEKIVHKVATVTGIGRISAAGPLSDKLLEADIDVFDDASCRNFYFNIDKVKLPDGILSKFMFCAGTLDGSKDACSADSGGPLVINDTQKCLKTQIGVTSFGKLCGTKGFPGVYTRVSEYVGWIEEIVFNNDSKEIEQSSLNYSTVWT